MSWSAHFRAAVRYGLAASAVFLGACASVPAAPETASRLATDAAFRGASHAGAVPTAWWTGFGDAELEALIDASLTASPVMRGADSSVDEADALVRLAALDRSPTLSSRASATAQRPSGGLDDFEASGSVALASTWEIDLFGRLGATLEAARRDADAARDLRRDLAVTLAAETSLAYIGLRSAQARLAVAQENANIQAESLALVRTLFENGRATQLDLDRSEAQYRTTLASLPVFQATIDASTNRLGALTGKSASSFRVMGGARGAIPKLAPTLTSGTPEDLLRRRPDIRVAENRLARALALGEAARAELFPSLSMNTNVLGLISDTGIAFNEGSISLGIGPVLSWAGPDLRRVYAGIDVRDAQTRRAAANYEAVVLDALAEAETALSDLASERRRSADLEAARAAARRALDLARLRFREGLDSSLDVLDAQRTLLEAEDRVVVNQAEIARRAVIVYRSLGGIFSDEDLASFRRN